MNAPLDPGRIMQTATAFWASKVLLTAVELDLFTTLGDDAMTAPQLGDALALHPRGTYDFFDALVALKFLDREGDGPEAGTGTRPRRPLFWTRTARRTSVGWRRCSMHGSSASGTIWARR